MINAIIFAVIVHRLWLEKKVQDITDMYLSLLNIISKGFFALLLSEIESSNYTNRQI